MNVSPLVAPNTAPTFDDLRQGDLFMNNGELCVKCQANGLEWAGFMVMGTGNVFIGAPYHFAPADGEWVIGNGVKA